MATMSQNTWTKKQKGAICAKMQHEKMDNPCSLIKALSIRPRAPPHNPPYPSVILKLGGRLWLVYSQLAEALGVKFKSGISLRVL